MPEAEDVLVDVGRHATMFVQDFWRRHRSAAPPPEAVALRDVARRLDVLIGATAGTRFPFRISQAPPVPTTLTRLLRRQDRPWTLHALPATDGQAIWLPPTASSRGDLTGLDCLRIWALQQALRATRGSAALLPVISDPLAQDLYLLIEAQAADEALGRCLPGMKPALDRLRGAACASRPPMSQLPVHRQPVEQLVSNLLRRPSGRPPATFPRAPTPAVALEAAFELARDIRRSLSDRWPHRSWMFKSWMYKDCWTGELRDPGSVAIAGAASGAPPDPVADVSHPVRSTRLTRRPRVRAAQDGEDDGEPGAWMVQPSAPQEHAEDPRGLQRPTDRDEETAAESFADSFSELPEARLVSSPGRVKEVLLSDDPPGARSWMVAPPLEGAQRFTYPEWDYRARAYRDPGATVRLVPLAPGPHRWVEDTLLAQRSMITNIRRRFDLLRALPQTLYRQLDGDDVDLDAHVRTLADFRAGHPLSQALYKRRAPARRSMAMLLLIDASGSTDAWISDQRRVVDIEREALLLVCLALEGVAEQFSALAFSGNGPGDVRIGEIKRFSERFDDRVADRIAGLQPDEYTRAGAAIRHATADLMTQKVDHRLLLLLSDGKPNDTDQYDGRYGFEDMRQAVNEARQQGTSPFCLTVDRQAAEYLPRLFGAGHYAMLPNPQLLPTVLLDWVRRLVLA